MAARFTRTTSCSLPSVHSTVPPVLDCVVAARDDVHHPERDASAAVAVSQVPIPTAQRASVGSLDDKVEDLKRDMCDLRDQIQSLTGKVDNLQARLEITGCRAAGTLGTEETLAQGGTKGSHSGLQVLEPYSFLIELSL